MNSRNKILIIANIGVNKKQIKFIDGIAREMRFSGGKKPSRSCILNTFIKIVMAMRVDVSGIKSEKGAEEKFFQAFKLDLKTGRGKNERNFISKSV